MPKPARSARAMLAWLRPLGEVAMRAPCSRRTRPTALPISPGAMMAMLRLMGQPRLNFCHGRFVPTAHVLAREEREHRCAGQARAKSVSWSTAPRSSAIAVAGYHVLRRSSSRERHADWVELSKSSTDDCRNRGGIMSTAGTERLHPLRTAALPAWTGQAGPIVALIVLLIGAAYAASGLLSDIASAPSPGTLIYTLLGIALLIALGFEFVNGFHDTANAVATVIYTHSMPAYFAVIWSGLFNFLGVLTSTGAVAFGIISLLPVALILQVGSEAGFAMVFALLIA